MRAPGASRVSAIFAVWALLVLPAPAFAGGQQTAGSIAGLVTDDTGAVLPGVTVEASSPVLIEKTRSVVSDDVGRYQITDLRPGTYEVTFTLPGFSVVRRSGIVLTTGFTANINADLKVGSVEETVTVTGETPVVDVQNVKQSAVMSREILETIPAGGQVQNIGILIPGASAATSVGATRDVGGLTGQTQVGLSLHGGRGTDQQQQVDGFPTYNWVVLAATSYSFVETDFQEYVFDTGSNSAETEAGGVRINLIPREGGNTFKVYFNESYSPTGLAPSNLDEDLIAKGLTASNRIKKQYFSGQSVGGPIWRNKIWFFAAGTQQANEYYVANSYYNACLECWTYTEDRNRQAYFDQRVRDFAVRGTWQASARHRISTFWGSNNFLNNHQAIGGAAKEETVQEAHNRDYFYIATWNAPLTNRLLVEAGIAASPQDQPYYYKGYLEGFKPAPPVTDSGFNVNYRTSVGGSTVWWNRNQAIRSSVSYVTGSHAAKVGFYGVRGSLSRVQTRANECVCSLQAVSGIPSGVTYYGDPVRQTNGRVDPMLAVYAQDQWRTNKLTMNLGLRFDYYHSFINEQNNGPTKWVPTSRLIPEIDGMHWKDLSPRLGVVYDLFGTGTTALKASASRYVQAEGIATVQQLNPLQGNNSVTRRWTDNGDRQVQGDPFNPLENGELGPSTNLKFGQPAVSLRLDPAWQSGFNTRPANWEFSGGIQQQLMPSVSLNAAFFRRNFINFVATENQAVSPSDYDEYCVTTPTDSRLGAHSNERICGLYDVKLNKVGLIDNVRTFASNYGDTSEHWQGFDVTMTARMQKLLLQGGVNTGVTNWDICGAMTGHPNISIALPKTDQVAGGLGLAASETPGQGISGTQTSLALCKAQTPWLTDLKLVASYELPYTVTVAATYQDSPGPNILSTGTFTNAQIQPSLGRALAGPANRSISMVPIGELYVQRLHQLDLRFGRVFRVGRGSFNAKFDMYNVFNSNPITAVSSVYGATTGSNTGAAWQQVQSILTARLVKFGVLIEY